MKLKKYPRVLSIILCLLLLVLPLASCGEPSSPKSQPSVQPANGSAENEPTFIKCEVTDVTDGDTIKVNLGGKTETIRLIGVDTPETVHPSEPVQPYGPEASTFTKEQLNGKTIYLEFDAQINDQYGRMLAYVWLDKPTDDTPDTVKKSMFNAILLSGGYAQIATYPPNVKYVDTFTEIQTEARTAETGLWGIKEEPITPPPTTPPQPKPAPTPQPQQPVENTVYITDTGTKYHRDGCRYLAKSKISITLSNAKSRGFEPCKVCNPPQ